MALINRVPRGLTSLLGTKALGQNPNQIEDVVRPTLDLTQLYLNETIIQTAAGVEILFVPTLGTVYADLTVPDGKAWWVYNVVTKMVATAAINVGFVPTLVFPSSVNQTQQQLVTGLNPVSLTTSAQVVVARDYDTPRLLPSGTQIGSYCFNNTNPGANVLTVITSITFVQVDI